MLQEKWCLTHFCYLERSQTKDKAYAYGENNCRETAGTLTRTPVSFRQLQDFLNLWTNTLHYCLRYHRFVSVTSNWGAGVKCSVYYNLWSREVSGGFRLLETELRKEPQLPQGWHQHPQSFQKCVVMALWLWRIGAFVDSIHCCLLFWKECTYFTQRNAIQNRELVKTKTTEQRECQPINK